MKKTLLLLLCCTLTVAGVSAQGKKRKASQYNLSNRENPFLHQQWWIGLKGGANVNRIIVDKSYSIIAPANYSVPRKSYEQYKPIGTQIGLEATYFTNGFSASIQPTYASLRFTYRNEFSWIDLESQNKQLELRYEQDHQMSYLYLPVLIKYELPFGGITPYIQGGAYTAFLLNATKTVSVEGIDYTFSQTGNGNSFSYEPVSVGAKDLFSSNHYGFIAGGGLYYNMGNIRLNLDVQYKFGRSLINSTTNRYQNDRLTGIGDTMDDIRMNNLAISFGTLFPLRFLSSGFKSFDK